MMSWHSLTHGLALGWSLVAVPLWIGLAQGRAPFRKWMSSPITALILLEAGQGWLKVDAETSMLAQMAAITC